jgi:hypothetical protein
MTPGRARKRRPKRTLKRKESGPWNETSCVNAVPPSPYHEVAQREPGRKGVASLGLELRDDER